MYSLYNQTLDVDLQDTVKEDIQARLDAADTAVTNFTGAMKPLKISAEPCRHAYMKEL